MPEELLGILIGPDPRCPICGLAGAACGGPTENHPIDIGPAIVEGGVTMAEREMVLVQVKDGDVRRFERKDAERFVKATEGARILGTPDKPEEPEEAEAVESTAADRQGDDEPKAKAQRPAEDKAVKGPAAEKGKD